MLEQENGCLLWAFLLYKALSSLILVNGFPLLGSPRLACQPPLHLFSLHLHLTLRVFCHPPLHIPLEKMFSPAQLAPSSPWGLGQLKTRQELSRAVMPSLRWHPAYKAPDVGGVWYVSPKKIILVSVVLEINIHSSARWWQHINTLKAMQSGWSDIFGLTVFRHCLTAHSHRHTHTNPLLYSSVSQLQACPDCPWLHSLTSLHNPCQTPVHGFFFFAPLAPFFASSFYSESLSSGSEIFSSPI